MQGPLLATCATKDWTVQLWDLSGGSSHCRQCHLLHPSLSLWSGEGASSCRLVMSAHPLAGDPSAAGPVRVLAGHGGEVCALAALPPDGLLLASGAQDDGWNGSPRPGSPREDVTAARGRSADPPMLIRIWNTTTGAVVRSLVWSDIPIPNTSCPCHLR